MFLHVVFSPVCLIIFFFFLTYVYIYIHVFLLFFCFFFFNISFFVAFYCFLLLLIKHIIYIFFLIFIFIFCFLIVLFYFLFATIIIRKKHMFTFFKFVVPYFRINSLNSRACLEFTFFHDYKKNEIQFIFFWTIMVEKEQPIRIFEKTTLNFNPIFWRIIVEKSRNSLNSRSALEFKEIPAERRK